MLCSSFLMLAAETTHTPQGDGNFQSASFLNTYRQETTHTPQGDGNRVRQLLVRHRPETTHTPQGDGNFA